MRAVQISSSKTGYSDLRFFVVFIRPFKGTLGFFLDCTTTNFYLFYNSASHQTHDSSVVRQTAKKVAATCPVTSPPLCLTSPFHITQILYTFSTYILMEFASSILIIPLLKSANFNTLGSEDRRKTLCFNTDTCPPNCTASISGHNNL